MRRGGCSGEDDTNYDNVILFAGYYRDPETWFYHVRNRFYHAELGRWLQRDPLGYEDGVSLYEYVRSKPAVTTDPHGLWCERTKTMRFAVDIVVPRVRVEHFKKGDLYCTKCVYRRVVRVRDIVRLAAEQGVPMNPLNGVNQDHVVMEYAFSDVIKCKCWTILGVIFGQYP